MTPIFPYNTLVDLLDKRTWDRKKTIMKKGADIVALLGKRTECEGRLSFQETVRIDGHLKGEISSQGSLIVGEEGLIEATIHTSTILISGEIHGDITASSRIEIHAPAKEESIMRPLATLRYISMVSPQGPVILAKPSGESILLLSLVLRNISIVLSE
jgi:hypothetical protein